MSPAGVADIVDSVGLPTIAGATPQADFAKVVAADAASLADTGILFPADPVGTLSPTDHAGILVSGRSCWDTFPDRLRWDAVPA